MALPLMPKATAVWLVENTALGFEQIAEFCGLHVLEVQAIADGEVATGMVGLDPIANGQLTQTEINRCAANPNASLRLLAQDLPQPVARSKGPRYTPVTKRGDKPDGVAWLLKNHPELSDAQITRLIGTTKPTIVAVRDRTHWNVANIKPRHPVMLGLCTTRELEEALSRARRRLTESGIDLSQGLPPGLAFTDDEDEEGHEEASGVLTDDAVVDTTIANDSDSDAAGGDAADDLDDDDFAGDDGDDDSGNAPAAASEAPSAEHTTGAETTAAQE